MIRLLFLLHRYLGMGMGLLMSMWCLSGLVMMYVGYPALDQRERVAHLAPIDWRACCQLSTAELGIDTVSGFRLEMLAGRPLLQLEEGFEPVGRYDLISGARLDAISARQAASVAAAYATPVRGASSVRGDPAAARLLGELDADQWTLAGVAPADRPLYHFSLPDTRGTQLYVSSSSGRVVQLTTRRERFWNWLGAVPHWLYFAALRRRPQLWSALIIDTALLGCFLTAIGLYIGVRQLLRRPPARWSPYRGFNLWHHLAGLLFGVFTLAWVLSGLLSMNPWGLLEGGDAQAARTRLSGAPLPVPAVEAALAALAAAPPRGVVSIQGVPLHGRLYLIASDRAGRRQRLDAHGTAAPLSRAELQFIASALGGQARLLSRGDDYYFARAGDDIELPVYRVIATGSDTRYYVDPLSGELLTRFDREDRRYRWWFQAPHRMDALAALRGRPQWDLLMWGLMSGVSAVCLTGTYLGWRRLTGRG